MSKLRTVVDSRLIFFCPGCKSEHAVNVTPGKSPCWTYNGNPERPTFAPSILVTCEWSHVDPEEKDDVCHSFVRDGQIQFLADCTHDLKNQTVEIPDWPYAPGAYGGLEESA